MLYMKDLFQKKPNGFNTSCRWFKSSIIYTSF